MQIKELVTFEPVRYEAHTSSIAYYESRLTIREGWRGKEYSAAIKHSVEELDGHPDMDGLYHMTVRELRRAIEKNITNTAFSSLT